MRTQDASRLFWTGIPGPDLDTESKKILSEVPPGGLILFGRNTTSDLARLQQLTQDLRRAVPETILAIDAEGGRVDRLRSLFGPAPSAAALGRRPVSWSERSGFWIGSALRRVGIDLNLAPVLDIDHGREGNALDERCFGETPRTVIARAVAFLRGLERAGICGCLKHYPGLGAAPEDTHLRGALIDETVEALEREECPFRKVMERCHPPAILVGHGVYPRLDRSALPASLSPYWLNRLRAQLGFSGAIVTDDLEMGALTLFGDLSQRSVQALLAGADALATCSRLELLPQMAQEVVRQAPPSAIRRALQQQRRLRQRLSQVARSCSEAPSLDRIRAGLERLCKGCS